MELKVRKSGSKNRQFSLIRRPILYCQSPWHVSVPLQHSVWSLSRDLPLKCHLPEGRGWVFSLVLQGLSRCLNIYLMYKWVDNFFCISPLFSIRSVKSNSRFIEIQAFFSVQQPFPTILSRSSSRVACNFNLCPTMQVTHSFSNHLTKSCVQTTKGHTTHHIFLKLALPVHKGKSCQKFHLQWLLWNL